MTPIDPWSPSIGTLLHDVMRLLRRRFEDEARQHGLTLPQWRAMVTIYKQAGITQAALASHIDSDAMTLSGILERLEKRGLIERTAHPDDSRAKLSRLTADGRALMAQSHDVAAQVFGQALEGLTPEARAMLAESLTCIRTNLTNQDHAAAEVRKTVK